MSRKKRSKPFGKPVLTFVIGLVVVVLLIFFAYSIQQYYQHGAQAGVVVCDSKGQQCTLSVHMHANVEATVCGEKLRLPLEKGSPDEPHTHKERNRIHLETNLPYDRQAQHMLPTSKLSLGTFFDEIGLRLNNTCIADKCNGDFCNGKQGQLTMHVNGAQVKQMREYVWHDEETIVLVFE